ncbi:hypothetical protein NXS19_014190 [Fusarium pseudograminearum]|nr:hypothetical protein NXS19_014190 [Fusarium pseudograminearum]
MYSIWSPRRNNLKDEAAEVPADRPRRSRRMTTTAKTSLIGLRDGNLLSCLSPAGLIHIPRRHFASDASFPSPGTSVFADSESTFWLNPSTFARFFAFLHGTGQPLLAAFGGHRVPSNKSFRHFTQDSSRSRTRTGPLLGPPLSTCLLPTTHLYLIVDESVYFLFFIIVAIKNNCDKEQVPHRATKRVQWAAGGKQRAETLALCVRPPQDCTMDA